MTVCVPPVIALKTRGPLNALEKLKAGIRAKVEHPLRVVKRQFGFTLVRYQGLKKNTAQLVTLFALSNLWMVRDKLLGMQARVRLQTGEWPGKRRTRLLRVATGQCIREFC